MRLGRHTKVRVLNHGDISCVSTHATKIFNTGEGGGLICTDSAAEDRAKKLRFFGYDDSKLVVDKGMNGKMTEIHAALGLANLKHLPKTIKHRSRLATIYKQNLSDSSDFRFQSVTEGANYSYFPIIFDCKSRMKECIYELTQKSIYPRQYFSPSLEQIECIQVSGFKSNIVHSADIAERIICLPIHDLVHESDALRISAVVKSVSN